MTSFLFLSYLVSMATTAAPAPATLLAVGDRAVVAVDIAETWVGPIAAGTVVTIVDLGPGALGPGEDYAAVLADGRDVSFAASELAPEHCPVDGGTDHEHCPLHGCVEYVCCIPAAPALDRALTFALIEVAMVILMGARRGSLTLVERAAFGREARELLEHGVQIARDAVQKSASYGVDRAATAGSLARIVQGRYGELDPRDQVVARGQLAELGYLAHLG